jgi:hypothetical protein
MKKRIAQLIFLQSIVFQLNAMDVPCYLTKMPIDIANNIASFLGWETEKAFITRTSKYPKSKSLHYCCTKSSDQTKTAIFNFYHDKEQTWPHLNVFEIRYNKALKIVDMSLPEECVFTALNFNRQGTHLLVHASHDDHGIMRKERMMITLKAIYYDKKRDKQNALDHYLRHHLVCKSIKGPH